MRWPASQIRRLSLALTLVAALLLGSGAAADTANRAGLVVRHDDGTLIYVLVTFTEDSITSEELLLRSGLEAEVAPFGGLGGAVCSLDGEGCPATDCFCKSYTSPAYFWHFYTLQDGAWVEELRGPASRDLHDGDIDGWSWTSGESQLPTVGIDEIAELANSGQEPEPTKPASAEASSTVASTVPAEATATSVAEQPTAVAVVVAPDGTPVAHTSTASNTSDTNWLIFAAMAVGVVLVGGLVALRRRKPRTR